MKEVKEILENICGFDADGEPNAIIGVQLLLLDEAGNEKKMIESENICKPEIRLYPNGPFCQMDIIFQTENDVSLQRIWRILERYTQMAAERASLEVVEDGLALLINLLPANVELDNYVISANPLLHCLTSVTAKQPPACIRMLFWAEDIHFFNSDPINTQQLDVEVDDEVRRRQLAEANMQDDRARRMEQMQRLEKMRKENK